MEIPAMCMIPAGFTGPLFGQIGQRARQSFVSQRRLRLAAISIAVSQHTFQLETLAANPPTVARYLGQIAILRCLPAKLHVNPFSLPNAEQEIYSGPMIEYAGFELGLWQLSHGLEWIAGIGLVATLAVPVTPHMWLNAIAIMLLGFLMVLALSLLAAGTARVAMDTTVRFYGQCTVAFILAILSSRASGKGAVMKIIRLLWKNLRGGVATLQYPAHAPMEEKFRGIVQFDRDRCTGCAMCRFRCTSGAIQFVAKGPAFTWSYNPGQCTFCGRCVEGCKDHALSQSEASPPIYLSAGTLSLSYTVQRKTPAPKSQPASSGNPARKSMSLIDEIVATFKITDTWKDSSNVTWFSTGNADVRDLAAFLSRAKARFMTITASSSRATKASASNTCGTATGRCLASPSICPAAP